MKCKNCLVDPICSIACDKLKDVTIKDLSEKVIERLLNCGCRLKLQGKKEYRSSN